MWGISDHCIGEDGLTLYLEPLYPIGHDSWLEMNLRWPILETEVLVAASKPLALSLHSHLAKSDSAAT